MLPNICVHAVNAENVKAEHTWHAWCTSDNHKPEHAGKVNSHNLAFNGHHGCHSWKHLTV